MIAIRHYLEDEITTVTDGHEVLWAGDEVTFDTNALVKVLQSMGLHVNQENIDGSFYEK